MMSQFVHGLEPIQGGLLLGLMTIFFMSVFIGYFMWVVPKSRTPEFEAASLLPLEDD